MQRSGRKHSSRSRIAHACLYEEGWKKPTFSKEGKVETVGLISKYRRISAWESFMIPFGSDGPIVRCPRPVGHRTIIEESSKVRTQTRVFSLQVTLFVMSLASLRLVKAVTKTQRSCCPNPYLETLIVQFIFDFLQ